MKKTSVLAILAAASLVASPILAQDTSSQASQVSSEASQASSEASSQVSSEVSSQVSSEVSGEASSAASQVSSAEDDGGLKFSLDVDVSFHFELTFEQAVEFERLVIETNPKPVEVDSSINVSVGTSVPSTITLSPLPATIIALYPQFEGFLFFLLPDGRIVVVNPTTLKIVVILSIN